MSTKRVSAIIDLDAIRHNIGAIRKILPAETKLMAVIKANAYGHGAPAVAGALVDRGADAFGVATVEEGVRLRQAGIKAPILILGYCFAENWETALTNDLTLTLFDTETAQALERLLCKMERTAKVHIKVDTGMSRIGLSADATGLETLRNIAALPHITIDGIFSHFFAADEEDLTAARAQYKQFADFIEAAKADGISTGTVHICNSAALCTLPEARADMVRCGIMTYGIRPSEYAGDSIPLRPALSLCSHVAFIKTLPAGKTVSYGGTFVTERETRVATIPVGYGDGYPRSLSGKGYVLIRGKKAPIIGRICMDQFMVDITDLTDVARLDKVTLIGRDGDETITAETLGQMSGRFHYELICDISERVERVYINE